MLSYRYADQVSVDDEVMVLRNDELMTARVMNVSSFMMQGNYSSTFSVFCFQTCCRNSTQFIFCFKLK